MRIAIIIPAVGHRLDGSGYPRFWRLEPLVAARLAALCPPEAEVRVFDDRFGRVAMDWQADLVLLTADTYSARRAYQIACDLRGRGMTVVMGGVHASLCPDEAARFADCVAVGQAEGVLPQIIDDWRCGRLGSLYRASTQPPLAALPRRSVYRQRYPASLLLETARGCRHACDYCSVAQVNASTWAPRPLGAVVDEIRAFLPFHRWVTLVDDNLAADLGHLRALIAAFTPLCIRWTCQITWRVAADPDLLRAMRASGCSGVLVGFESLRARPLAAMNKGFNPVGPDADQAVRNFHRQGIPVYGTFIIGADGEDPADDGELADFVDRNGLFMAAFNTLTPYPGTGLHARLRSSGRLPRPDWWLDPAGTCGGVVFVPARGTAGELAERCRRLRARHHGWRSQVVRGLHRHHWRDPAMALAYWRVNPAAALDVGRRDHLPFGDPAWSGTWRD